MYITFDALTARERELVEAAGRARQNAYAPYSRYKVGAAIRTKDGKIIEGANIENASYGLTICAERTATFKAVYDGDKKWEAIAVLTVNSGMPCGACRQVLFEFNPDLIVIVSDESKQKIQKLTVNELLPHGFGPSQLS